MNMLKRSLAMMLVLCMLFTMAPITAFAEDTTDPAGTAVPAADGDLGDNTTNEEILKTVETPKVDESEDDVTKDDITEDDVTKDDVTKDDVTKDDVTKDDVTKDDVTKDDVTKDDVTKDDETKDDEDEVVTDPTEDPYGIDLTALDTTYTFQYRILHLDCGRKYFSVDWIKALINEMSAAGYNQLQLAFGNDGLRFLLDDMSVNGYSSEAVKAGIQQGNKNYYDAGEKNELTQAEMTEIITHANSKGIAIVPHVNMPGHMDAIVDAIEYVGISNAHFTGWTTSERSLNLNNTEAVSFTKALLQKYVTYFKSQGCSFFHIGADEYGNDAYGNSMGFPSMGSSLYTKFASFVNDCAAIVKNAGMTPRAWNDGISYGEYTDSFDPDIQVTYWSDGWNGYNVASAEALRNNGHAMINTHSSYYFILTGNGITNPSSNGFSNTSFMGSTISDPIGSMFCIWCDVPGSATEEQVAAAARITLRKMAAAMNGTSSYSEEIVPGGFNADGTIAEDCNILTVKDVTSGVEVTGCDLTSVTATEAEAPEIEGAVNVKAWDITPYVGTEKHTTSATVKAPVPDGWDTNRLGAFIVEADNTVTLIQGTYADGYYTFKMDHFSVGGLYQAAPTAEGDTTITDNRTIDLILGETKTDAIQGGDYSGTYTSDVATVTAEYEQVEGATGPVQVTDISVGSAYYLSDGNGSYLTSNAQWTTDINAAAQWTVEQQKEVYYLHNSGNYLYYNSWYSMRWEVGESVNDGDPFEFDSGIFTDYDKTLIPFAEGTASVDQTTVTFTGTAIGSATVDVGPVRYTVNVKYAEKTINIEKETTRTDVQSVTVGDYTTGAAMDNDYVTANWNGNTVTFTAKSQTGTVDMIIGNTKYTVNVITVDLSTVEPLTIEYWITNAHVNGTTSDKNELTINATDTGIYSEDGVAVKSLADPEASKDNRTQEYWRSVILDVSRTNESPDGTEQQTLNNGDDETWSGAVFTHVRYWNGWEVKTGESWVAVDRTNVNGREKNQLIAYYMEVVAIENANGTSELHVNAADWGFASGQDWGYNPGVDPATLTFQIVYEDGSTNPVNTELVEKTLIFGYYDGRGIGSIRFASHSDYEIYKVTATTGTNDATLRGQAYVINSLNWNNDETVVWSGDLTDVVDISSKGNNTPEATQKMQWTANNDAILIRIYIKAVEKEEALTVVYYDEKFGDTLYTYNISVAEGTDFNNGIIDSSEFKEDTTRIDVSKAHIVNVLGINQHFQTDLTKVPEAVGKYRSDLYEYTGSKIENGGKTLYLYYNIDTEVLSPNFVVDFGLSLTFGLDYLLSGNTTVEDVEAVSGLSARYGTLTYDPGSYAFTYTPTKVLQNIDVLTITLTIAGTTSTTNVGVTPATTVYYEENFLTYGANWSTPDAPIRPQVAEVLGYHGATAERHNYGYDPAYVRDASGSNGTSVSTSTNGATASFTFTGTGFALYANCNEGTGYVTLTREGSTKKMYMMDTGLNYSEKVTMPGAEENPSGWFYNIPIITEKNLSYGTYTVTIRKTNNDNQDLEIDGIRIYNTIQDSSIFVDDLEDNPVFYELRDVVLTSLGVQGATSSQVYAALPDPEKTLAVVTHDSIDYANAEDQDAVQALLDNGPKNEVYLHPKQTLTFKIKTDRVVQIGLKAPNGTTTYKFEGDTSNRAMNSSVDMFYPVLGKADSENRAEQTISVTNTGEKILAITDLKVCDDPGFSFVALNEADIAAILHEETEPEAPTYTMVELKGTDVLIDGTVFDYTGKAIEPAITVNVGGTQLVEGRDYSVTYTNNVEPGTATVTVRGIATASETLGYTGEVSIDYTINAPAEPEVPEETTKPVKPGNGNNKPTDSNKPGNGNNKPTESTKPGNGNNKPGNGNNNSGKPSADKNEKQKDAKLKITFVNLFGKKVGTADLVKTGAANQYCVFSAAEIVAKTPARRIAVWLLPVMIPYGSTTNIVVPVI